MKKRNKDGRKVILKNEETEIGGKKRDKVRRVGGREDGSNE